MRSQRRWILCGLLLLEALISGCSTYEDFANFFGPCDSRERESLLQRARRADDYAGR